MRNTMRGVLVLAVACCLSQSALAQVEVKAPPGITVVTPEPVEIQFIRGEIRFCEKANVKGITCVMNQKILGMKSKAARDWWSPETYIQARTGLSEFTLYDVSELPSGQLAIRFSP